jgi:hypothetical protein
MGHQCNMFQFQETSLGITIQNILKITPTQNPDASVKQWPDIAPHSNTISEHNKFYLETQYMYQIRLKDISLPVNVN